VIDYSGTGRFRRDAWRRLCEYRERRDDEC